MTCNYKRREPNYLLAPARLPVSWREDEPGLAGHDNAVYARVALSYASTGIKPVVGSILIAIVVEHFTLVQFGMVKEDSTQLKGRLRMLEYPVVRCRDPTLGCYTIELGTL